MTDVPEEQAVQELETLLTSLADTEAQLADAGNEFNKETQVLVAKYAAKTDLLTIKREETVTLITEIFQTHRDTLTDKTGKTVTLRGGTLSARLTSEALEIIDEPRLEKYLRRNGRWMKYTIQPKRRLDKSALKKDRLLVESAPTNIMHFRRDENLIIKLPKLQFEIKRILHPLRGALMKS